MPEPQDASLRFTCPRCGAWLKAPAAEAGVKHRCPGCRSAFLVPKTTQTVAPPVEAAEDEEYPLCEGIGQPPPDSPAYQVHIPVTCPLCGTRMLGTEDQVGRQLVCPDCGTPVVVPAPSVAPAKQGSPAAGAEGVGGYDVYQGEGQPPGAGEGADRAHVAAVCSVCGTRLDATEDQVGRHLECPDCSTPILVTPRPEPAPRLDSPAARGEEYGVGQPAESPDYQPEIDARLSRTRPGESLEHAERLGLVRTRPAPPRWPFFSGVFTFPIYRNSWPHWIGLSMAATAVIPLLFFAAMLLAFPGAGWLAAAPWIFGMVFFVVACFFGVIWAAVTSAFLLAILQDTAAGADEVEDWPNPLSTDWVQECFYVINSFSLSVLCGVPIAQILGYHNPAGWLGLPAAVFLIFPVILLSMLEAGSPLKPVSLPVWQSLAARWRAWAVFYVEAAVLAVAFFLLLGPSLLLPWLLAIPLLAAGLVAALMIYFRLLGRLAWCCADRAAEEEERERKLLHGVETPAGS